MFGLTMGIVGIVGLMVADKLEEVIPVDSQDVSGAVQGLTSPATPQNSQNANN